MGAQPANSWDEYYYMVDVYSDENCSNQCNTQDGWGGSC